MAKPIARRRTAEDTTVELWSNGAITWGFGRYIKGSPHARTAEQVSQALAAGWLVLGDVAMYDDAELPDLIAAARWTALRDGLPGTMRARFAQPRQLRPFWTTIETDRDGRPRVQCWRLPRLRWPGLAVWREAGRYSVWTEVQRTGTYEPTGVEFTNLRDLQTYLESYK